MINVPEKSKNLMWMFCPKHGPSFFRWFDETDTGYCLTCESQAQL